MRRKKQRLSGRTGICLRPLKQLALGHRSPSQKVSGALYGISLGQIMLFNLVQTRVGVTFLMLIYNFDSPGCPLSQGSDRNFSLQTLSQGGSFHIKAVQVFAPSRASFHLFTKTRISQVGWYSHSFKHPMSSGTDLNIVFTDLVLYLWNTALRTWH